MAIFTALAAAVGFITTALTSVGLSSAAAGIAANLIIGTGLSALASAFSRPPTAAKFRVPETKAVTNQAIAARVRGYGRMKLGGVRAFYDSENGRLHQVIMLHSGEIAEFVALWVGDRQVTLDENGWVEQGPWNGGFIRILNRPGTSSSVVYATMQAYWPSVWTDDHRLRGIATLYAEFVAPKADKINNLFPELHTTPIRATCDLSLVYDPRTDMTAFSRNPAICIRDYLLHEDGYRLDLDDIDEASFAAKADIDDETVTRKSGSTEARYALGGVYSFQDDPKDTLASLCATNDGELFETPEGKIGIRGGAWEEPTVTITDRDILSYDLEEGADRFAAFNELKTVYRSIWHDYEMQETAPWIDHMDQSRRGKIVEDLTLEWVQSATQAQRLAKIHAFKSNPKWQGTISTNLVGLNARGERVIRLIIPELEINDVFRVVDHGIRSDLSGCEIAVSALSQETYLWDPVTEEGDEAPPPAETSPDGSLPVPVIDTIAVENREFTAATTAPVVIVTVEAGRDDLSLQAQIRLDPDGPWAAMTVSDDLSAVSGPLVANDAYQVRVRWLSADDTGGEWSAPENVTATP